jgi:hypothetical protein
VGGSGYRDVDEERESVVRPSFLFLFAFSYECLRVYGGNSGCSVAIV